MDHIMLSCKYKRKEIVVMSLVPRYLTPYQIEAHNLKHLILENSCSYILNYLILTIYIYIMTTLLEPYRGNCCQQRVVSWPKKLPV